MGACPHLGENMGACKLKKKKDSLYYYTSISHEKEKYHIIHSIIINLANKRYQPDPKDTLQ